MEAMAVSAVQQGSAERAAETDSEPGQVRGRWPAPGTIHGAWTADDLERLPDDGLRYEIIDGTLIVSPAPLPVHQIAIGGLYSTLVAACPTDSLVLLSPVDWQPDGATSVQPDLLVMRTADVTRRRLLGTPRMLVEVRSPSTGRIDRTVKVQRYAEAGVPQYWIVDPGEEDRDPSVEVYDLVDGEYRLQARAAGKQSVTVSGPVPVTVTPDDLVRY